MTFDPETLQSYPQDPGVYLMKDPQGSVIYVGKAKNLRQRLKQYFIRGRDTRAMIPILIAKVHTIDTIIVPTEKQALLLENTLIKKHKPQYNVLLKDDKTFAQLYINTDHPYPMIQLVRRKKIAENEKGLFFGPYTSAYAAREVFNLMNRLFPLRQCSDEELKRRTRPCILYAMKRCIAPCVHKCQDDEYALFVKSAIKFLKGQDEQILKSLTKEMKIASDNLEFEKAAAIHKTIEQINYVTKSQHLVLQPSHQEFDLFTLFRHQEECIVIHFTIREGKLTGSEHYTYTNLFESDDEILESFILQHYDREEFLPKEILVPLLMENASLLTEILKERFNKKTLINSPQKGERKQLLDIAFNNAKSLFERQKDQKVLKEKLLLDLQETLHLSRYPEKIECYDTSNISGSNPVASMVSYVNGEKERKRYRLFKIKDLHKSDDYQAMHQTLTRRLIRAKEEDDLPDLIIIDGGKGHLNIVLEVLKELDIATVDAISLAKENALHTKGMTQEKIFLPRKPEPLLLSPRSPLLFFLQAIRDEAHRSAITFHKKRRKKELIKTELDTIPGIGPVKRKALLVHFGSIQQIKEASKESLAEVKGLSKKDIETIFHFFRGKSIL